MPHTPLSPSSFSKHILVIEYRTNYIYILQICAIHCCPRSSYVAIRKSNQNKEQLYIQASPPATQSLCPLLGASSTPRGHDGAKKAPTCVNQCLPILKGVKTPSPAPANLHPSLPE